MLENSKPLIKNYEIKSNSPKVIEWDIYSNNTMEEYKELLRTEMNTEFVFQQFLEKNPYLYEAIKLLPILI